MASRNSDMTNGHTRIPSTADGASDTKGSNSAERKKIIREVARNLDQLDAAKAGIQDDSTAEKARIKGIGMKMKDFNAARRLYKLEEGERDQAMDSFREACEALGFGSTLDWVKATGQEPEAPKPEEAAKAAGLTAEIGRQAYRDNKRLTDNPHSKKSPSYQIWHDGFMEEQLKNAKSMGEPAVAPA